MILYDRETVNGGKLMEENKNVIAETGDKEEVVSKNFIAMSKPDSHRNPTDIFILVMPSPLF